MQYSDDYHVDWELSLSGAQILYTNQQIMHYKYDSRGNLTDETLFDSRGNIENRINYSRNSSNQIISEKRYSKSGILWYSESYHYSIGGRLITTTGRSASKDHNCTYTYFDNGEIQEECSRSDPTGSVRFTTIYNKKGYMIDERQYISLKSSNFKQPESQSIFKYEVEDEKGNWTKMKELLLVTKFGKSFYEPWKVTYRTISYYK